MKGAVMPGYSAHWRTGDAVMIRRGEAQVAGEVILASPNGASLILGFEAIFDGHVGTMPVLREDDGQYVSIADGRVVELIEP
jgi:hypothetical protein